MVVVVVVVAVVVVVVQAQRIAQRATSALAGALGCRSVGGAPAARWDEAVDAFDQDHSWLYVSHRPLLRMRPITKLCRELEPALHIRPRIDEARAQST